MDPLLDGSPPEGRIRRWALAPWRAFRALCMSIGFLVILGFVGGAAGTVLFLKSLPDLDRYDFARLKSQAVVRVNTFYVNKARRLSWTPMHLMSQELRYAIVFSEDATFYHHAGVMTDAILEAALRNVKEGRYASGGSTITQQVAKNVFLSREKSIIRKLKELVLTWRLEERFTKNEILEVYLNVAEFGPDLFGVGAASRHYFGKPPSEVNAAEGAFMGLMLPSPKKYHRAVFENQRMTPARRQKVRRVLRDMLIEEIITPEQYEAYLRYSYFEPGDRATSSLPFNR